MCVRHTAELVHGIWGGDVTCVGIAVVVLPTLGVDRYAMSGGVVSARGVKK